MQKIILLNSLLNVFLYIKKTKVRLLIFYNFLGVPEDRNAFTVNKVCSSSLKALIIATQSIQLDYRQKCLVVGAESMSQTPRYVPRELPIYGNTTTIVNFFFYFLKL